MPYYLPVYGRSMACLRNRDQLRSGIARPYTDSAAYSGLVQPIPPTLILPTTLLKGYWAIMFPMPLKPGRRGDQRHLSAESGLYCRSVVEGLWGFEAVGLREFTICPRLPKRWKEMSLSNVYAFNKRFDMSVVRIRGRYRVRVQEAGKPAKMLTGMVLSRCVLCCNV